MGLKLEFLRDIIYFKDNYVDWVLEMYDQNGSLQAQHAFGCKYFSYLMPEYTFFLTLFYIFIIIVPADWDGSRDNLARERLLTKESLQIDVFGRFYLFIKLAFFPLKINL